MGRTKHYSQRKHKAERVKERHTLEVFGRIQQLRNQEESVRRLLEERFPRVSLQQQQEDEHQKKKDQNEDENKEKKEKGRHAIDMAFRLGLLRWSICAVHSLLEKWPCLPLRQVIAMCNQEGRKKMEIQKDRQERHANRRAPQDIAKQKKRIQLAILEE